MGVRTAFSDEAIEDVLLKLHRTMSISEFVAKHGCDGRQFAHLVTSLRREGARIPHKKRIVKTSLLHKIKNYKATHPGLFEELVNKNLPKNMQPREDI